MITSFNPSVLDHGSSSMYVYGVYALHLPVLTIRHRQDIYGVGLRVEPTTLDIGFVKGHISLSLQYINPVFFGDQVRGSSTTSWTSFLSTRLM